MRASRRFPLSRLCQSGEDHDFEQVAPDVRAPLKSWHSFRADVSATASHAESGTISLTAYSGIDTLRRRIPFWETPTPAQGRRWKRAAPIAMLAGKHASVQTAGPSKEKPQRMQAWGWRTLCWG